MGIQAPAHEKFAIIERTLQQSGNGLSTTKLCELAGVSRSGYYNWLKTKDNREAREYQDMVDFKLIELAYEHRGYAKGARGIKMNLEHNGILMNLKKIYRLMHKFGLKCEIRRKNPYRRMLRENRSSKVAPNVVKRKFTSRGPRTILLTDITYLFYHNGTAYLSTILDACTREVLAYQLSSTLKIDFVLNTVHDLIDHHGFELDDEVIVHSDQGAHYTSRQFIQLLQESDFIQSMSRKGNCWDNAPQESFFGHMKDEIRFYISEAESIDQVRYIVDDWMDYYNNERYQWDLKKLSPCEYYDYLTTGFDPLEKFRKS